MKQAMILAVGASIVAASATAQPTQPELSGEIAPRLNVDGATFKDLNRNGSLDGYEDWRLPVAERVDNLIGQMTLEEKAGLMMHGTAPSIGNEASTGRGGTYDTAKAEEMIQNLKVVSFITRLAGEPELLAEQNNMLQQIAEGGRLGIPATISTDPRNHFQFVLGASNAAGGFTQWPEMTGFAAIGDAALMRRFADLSRQEYRAVGIQQALSPQVDLATEPRWSRAAATFGDNPQLAKTMAEAYVAGFQNGTDGINRDSVVAVAKHWVGYGNAPEGLDSHNSYAKPAVFTNETFAPHIIPFEGAFAAKVAGVMPTYSVIEGVTVNGNPLEPVGAGYERTLLTDLLRGTYGFDGVILSDWMITTDCKKPCLEGEVDGNVPKHEDVGMPWGVEDLSRVDRFAKAVLAGVDQFGGVTSSDLLVEAVTAGKVPESRIDESARRILTQKFQQGLFESAYVDPAEAAVVLGNPEAKAEAQVAQARAMVLLENRDTTLPINPSGRIFLHGVDPAVATARGYTVVDNPADADLALVRLNSPFQRLHPNYFFGSRYEEGDLDFKDDDAGLAAFNAAAAATPTIVAVSMSRPAIVTPLRDKAAAILATFGASDEALFDVVEGKQKAEGRLPFELPSSMEEVAAQKPDLPNDLANPLYPVGHGLDY